MAAGASKQRAPHVLRSTGGTEPFDVHAHRHDVNGGAQAPEVRVTAGDGGCAVIEVRDHGPGIPEAEREKIFAPFYRLQGSAETGRGNGLGLALVRQIARSHGGDVQCLAADGGGSLFRVTLPLTRS